MQKNALQLRVYNNHSENLIFKVTTLAILRVNGFFTFVIHLGPTFHCIIKINDLLSRLRQVRLCFVPRHISTIALVSVLRPHPPTFRSVFRLKMEHQGLGSSTFQIHSPRLHQALQGFTSFARPFFLQYPSIPSHQEETTLSSAGGRTCKYLGLWRARIPNQSSALIV